METRQGIAVSPGVAIGPAVVLGAEGFRIPQRLVAVDIVDSEVQRLHGALQSVIADLETHEALASARLGRQ
ncbi:MAG: phosphoenolpyruvate-utilizing N-terminal domain-containing protein, partial [Planctomycetaceae bacterium]